MPLTRTSLLAPLLAAAALALPGAASASTFCVHAPDCPAGRISTGDDLQAALNDALATSTVDTVLVGDKGSPYVGPFTYSPALATTNKVTIRADGTGRPVLTSTLANDDNVLTLDEGTLDGIDVLMPTPAEGVAVRVANTTLRDVTVSSNSDGPGGGGIEDDNGQTVLDNVRVVNTGDASVTVKGAEIVGFNTSLTARDLRVSGDTGALDVVGAANVNVSQSQLVGLSNGLQITGGAVSVDRTTVATTNANSAGVVQVDDPLLNGRLALNHVTVAHEGPKSGPDTALLLRTTNSNSSVSLQASAFAGYSHGIVRTVASGHTIDINAQDSVYHDDDDDRHHLDIAHRHLARYADRHRAGAHQPAPHPAPDLGQAGTATASAPDGQRAGHDPDRGRPPHQRAHQQDPYDHAQRAGRQQHDPARPRTAPPPAAQGRSADSHRRRQRPGRASHRAPNAPADAAALTTPNRTTHE
jgi:hypothetical protein